jgi:peptidyl-prolyl cis-trans isomerase SurA
MQFPVSRIDPPERPDCNGKCLEYDGGGAPHAVNAMNRPATGMNRFGRNCRALAAATLVAAAAAVSPARAQTVVAFVNGEPITALDVEQRAKLIELQTHQPPVRQKVIDELIDEKLQIREAKRWGIEISDSEVDTSFAFMATHNAHLANADQFAAALRKEGVNIAHFKARIRAQIAWPQLVRGRYQASLEIGEQDLLTEMLNKKTDADAAGAGAGYEYTLRPILFIVPPGSPPSAFEDRKREAEALRNRFRSCDDGLPFARELREVNVRDQIVRSSADVPPELRKGLDSVPVGQLTTPEVTKLGIEMFAVCSKAEAKSDNAPGKRAAREALFNAKFAELSKRYLTELRRAALIEYR